MARRAREYQPGYVYLQSVIPLALRKALKQDAVRRDLSMCDVIQELLAVRYKRPDLKPDVRRYARRRTDRAEAMAR